MIPNGIDLGAAAGDGGPSSLQILTLLTVLAILPGVVLTVTAFPRILIVLGFVRNALGTPTFPPNQVLVGIAMFLTLFVMGPTFTKVNSEALQPFLNGNMEQREAVQRGLEPVRAFMFKQTRDDDLSLFVRLAKLNQPETRADIPTRVLVPAFILSELKTAFQIGFLIYLPFLVIDMVVSSILMSMGMMMLPPVVISLPFKVLLFVLVDGWHLVVEGLVNSFHL
jgi:flagellar biosynthetic protein FliP